MSKQLFVDQVYQNGAIAMTTNPKTVAYNLILLERFNSGSAPIFTCGKYVCMIVGNDSADLRMFFMDIKKDPASSKLLAQYFAEAEKKKLTTMLELYHSKYEEEQDDYELVTGVPPSTMA